MNVLFNDVLQYSDAPRELTSSSLADYYENPDRLEITLHEPSVVDCVGIGNMDSDILQVELTDANNGTFTEHVNYGRNGLYLLKKRYLDVVEIGLTFTCSHVGRFACGKAVCLRTSIPKEPTLVSTNKPRVTLSGQVIDGLGGYDYWRVSLDTRYKIDKEKLREIINGFRTLSKGLPLFVYFGEESERLPFDKMYCSDTSQQELSFESSINKPLFSRRFVFEERF
jgi:hypothetical protein